MSILCSNLHNQIITLCIIINIFNIIFLESNSTFIIVLWERNR